MEYTETLPSQTGDEVCKGLFPSIHLYYPYASDNFVHGPDPDVRESRGLIPKGTDVTDEQEPLQPHFASQQRARQETRDQMTPLGSLCPTAQAAPTQNPNGKRQQFGSQQVAPMQEIFWRPCKTG